MKVTAIKYKNAREDGVVENYYRRYLDHEGLAMAETLAYETRSDITEKHMERISCDNGRTWGEWVDIPEDTSTKCFQGEHQLVYDLRAKMWNPVHKHTVQLSTSNIMVNGYDFAMSMKWQGNNNYQVYHSYLNVVRENGDKTVQMIKYQDGEEFDPDNWVKPTFLDNNCSLCRSNIELDTNGDILFTAEVPMRTCCEILGRDIMEVYPSYPDFPKGVIFIRGSWDGEKYNFTYSRPLVISDLLSSRGFDECTIAKLKSGRIIIIMRGSNHKPPSWTNNRINPSAPGLKWYAWSDDNGKTFTDAMPWHFDDGEIVYSSATYSRIIKDERTGKHYWIGNITDHRVSGNYPRYPLQIVELDETYGTAKKESYTVIDTMRDGEPKWVQLSNFNLLQNRETGRLEVMLTKFGQFQWGENSPEGNPFKAEVWRYEIELE